MRLLQLHMSHVAKTARYLIIVVALWCYSLATLANDYEQGTQAYLAKNYTEAYTIMQALATSGHTQAQIMLGFFYEHGYGVQQDFDQAIQWYIQAADQDVTMVQHELGLHYFSDNPAINDYKQAAHWWQRAADLGYDKSQYNLGMMYYRGIGVDINRTQAKQLFESAASQGHPKAQYSLGVMYAFGEHATQNYQQALYWFQQAADQGIPQAMFNLGIFYEHGYAISKNEEVAYDWYRQAANLGLELAQTKISQKADKSSSSPTSEITAETPAPEITAVEEPLALNPEITAETLSENNIPQANNYSLSQWLAQQNTNDYTLQIASTLDKDSSIEYIKHNQLEDIGGYIEVMINNEPRYNIIYGSYATWQVAENAINDLPNNIQKNKPWIRKIGTLKKLLISQN